MHCSIVLTINIGRGPATAAVTDSATGRTEPLPLSADEQATARSQSPQALIPVTVARAAVAHARNAGVVTGPDTLVVTHPEQWSGEQVQAVLEAAATAGFAPDRVTVIPSTT